MSSTVTVTLVAVPPPTCEKNTLFWPPGLTSIISRSCGAEWVSRFKVSVRLVMFPDRPDTWFEEG